MSIVCSNSNLNNIDKGTPTNYQLIFPLIPSESSIGANNPFVMNIHTAMLPAVSLAIEEHRWQGTKANVGLIPMEFDPWMVSFTVDSRLANWKLLFDWMSYINNNNNKISEYHGQYSVDSSLVITDNYGNSALEIIFVSIWPGQLQEVSFSQREGDILLESTVTFNYDYFYIRDTSWPIEFSSSSSSQSLRSSSSSSNSSSSSSSISSSSSSESLYCEDGDCAIGIMDNIQDDTERLYLSVGDQTWRNVIPSASIGTGGVAYKIFIGNDTGQDLSIGDMWIGHQPGVSADLIDYPDNPELKWDRRPSQVTFDGPQLDYTIPSGGRWSDLIPEPIDPQRNLVLSWFWNDSHGSNMDYSITTSASNPLFTGARSASANGDISDRTTNWTGAPSFISNKCDWIQHICVTNPIETVWDTNKVGYPDEVIIYNNNLTAYSKIYRDLDASQVLGSTYKTSGKWYFEIEVHRIDAWRQLRAGFQTGDEPLDNLLGNTPSGWGYQGGSTQGIYNDATRLYDTKFIVGNARIQIALDLDNGYAWFRNDSSGNNDWVNGGEPALGTSPTITNIPSGARIYPAISFRNYSTNTDGQEMHGYFSAPTFRYSVPEGFNAWDDDGCFSSSSSSSSLSSSSSSSSSTSIGGG